jgi:hypothetical protein
MFRALLAATVAFEGIRAGAGTFRALLDLPARWEIGPVTFAVLSRATDLSAAGIAFYSVYGIGGFVLTLAAWILGLRAGTTRTVKVLTGLAALCSALILVLTVQAAPLMFSIGASPDDPVVLTRLIEPFVFWTNLRIVLTVISFGAVLLALTTLAGSRGGRA